MNDISVQDLDSRLTMLFQEDELAAYEHQRTLERVTPLEPEKKLMLAVLEDGIMCFQRYLQAKNGKEKKLYDNAAAWIFDQDDIGLFSFENICQACELDPAYLRIGLLNWRERMKSAKAQLDKAPLRGRSTMRQWGMRGHKR